MCNFCVEKLLLLKHQKSTWTTTFCLCVDSTNKVRCLNQSPSECVIEDFTMFEQNMTKTFPLPPFFSPKVIRTFWVSLSSSLPGSSSNSWATAVESDMCGVGGESGEDAIRISIRKCMHLHGVVGACRDQLSILWRQEHICEYYISTSVSCCVDSLWGLSVEINYILWIRGDRPTLSAREYTFSPMVMNFGSSSSRPSHIRTSPSFPQVTKNLKKSV